ncbi:MAG: phosphatidylglycerophosphatase A [Nitrospirota bacterium]|jgi:phosphatidylglycerophosphatase A
MGEQGGGVLFKLVATVGYLGFVPVAPGTMGTLAALAVVALTKLPWPSYLILTIASVLGGTWAADKMERVMGEKDPGCIVIDEFAGFLVAMAFLPRTMGYLLAAFILFRVFDILKPPPIDGLQSSGGGWGVMVDDLAAGLLVNLLLQAWRLLA